MYHHSSHGGSRPTQASRILGAMSRHVPLRALLPLFVALAAPTLAAQGTTPAADTLPPPASFGEALTRAQRASAARDYPAMARALRAALGFAPENGAMLYNLARAEARMGDTAGALRTLQRLAPQGLARDVAGDSLFARLRSLRGFAEVTRRLAEEAAPVVRGDTAFTLPDPHLIPEGIAYDPAGGGTFYVGSLGKRSVLRVAPNGTVSEFIVPGREWLGQVLGLRVEPRARRLWLATLVVDTAAPRFRRGPGGWAALHAYDLATGRLVRRIAAPDSTRPHLLNDIAITPAGDLYVTDSEGDALYRLPRGSDALERVHGAAPDFTYPNGVAVTPDGTRLYVAHVEGLSVLPLGGRAPGTLARVRATEAMPTGGIDGLYACANDRLVAVQGRTDFQQITAFTLARDGRSVVAARALERRHPAHDAATTGAIARGSLYYIANAQLGRLGPDGTVAPGPNARPSVVLRVPLGDACAGAGR